MRILRGGVVAAVAAATLMAVPVPNVFAAAPAVVAAVPESTQEDKARAMVTLGWLPEGPMLRLPDKDFVIALWRRATGVEVRAAAELAFAGTVEECTQFIKFGLGQANTRDQNNEIRDATIARAARELRQKAAVVGIAADPELLILGNHEFIRKLYDLVTGERVKQAAFIAFGQSDEEQRRFLESGIVIAHAADQQAAIDADKEATEAQRAQMAARNARGRAYAVIGVVATDAMKNESDDNVIRGIINRAAPETFVLYGAIKDHWDLLGGLNSYLGYPTSDVLTVPGGLRQMFQGGRIDFDPVTGVPQAYKNP